jgi:hypothetical protein
MRKCFAIEADVVLTGLAAPAGSVDDLLAKVTCRWDAIPFLLKRVAAVQDYLEWMLFCADQDFGNLSGL